MRVAVVGAGIAGLSAARELRARGHDVSVYEKQRVPGGRNATRKPAGIELPRGLAGASLTFDYGAQYFTARDDRFSAVVAEWLRDRVVAQWTGRIVSFDAEGWEDVEESTARYVGTPGMSAITGAMTDGLGVSYAHNIESLPPLLERVDHVVVAVPAPHAAALVAHFPNLADRVTPVVMKPNWTVMAAFEERVAARFDAA